MSNDVVAHVKTALSSTSVDGEVTEYVADMVNDVLQDGEPGRGFDEMVEELVDAAGPMLGEFIGDSEIQTLFETTVTHFLGDDKDGDGLK